tara:strand:+ start:171 stop:950 length:780 start_codon:yes stop_codon:yes gene_type:complete
MVDKETGKFKEMKVIEKEFDKELLNLYLHIKDKCSKDFIDLTIVNNIFLIFNKLFENKGGCYLECGVFRGGTLIPVINFIKSEIGMELWDIIGVDTFNGFPSSIENHYNDLPSKFIELYRDGLITKEHFNKAKIRTNNFNDTSHLETNYFNYDFSDLVDFCKKNNVSLLKGKFEDILDGIEEDINILHIDCDLYESYLECLNKLYDNVVKGGSIIFDEYYSHKYPGARIAVNEFFEDKKGYFEKYNTPEGFERWCFVKG